MLRFLIVGLCFFSFSSLALAHQVKVVFPQAAPILIHNPDVSQSFYAELSGTSQEFRIVSPEPFWLSLELLVPMDVQNGADYSATVELIKDGGNEPFIALSGTSSAWEPFHEPYAGDDYLAGPNYEGQAPAGEYRIVVQSPDNLGKFVLVVGTLEKWGPRELFAVLKELPVLKAYLGVSPLYAYTNRLGAIFGGMLAILGLLVWIFLKILKRRKVTKLPRVKV